jgi:uncharacterized coiled-coil protein SlyX
VSVEVVELRKRMEELRRELNKLMENFDTCDKKRLLKVSRELDMVINTYVRMEQGMIDN